MPKISGNPTSILDAGCGRGVFTYLMARKFPEATVRGIDTDQNQLRKNSVIAKIAKFKNVYFEQQNVSALSFTDEFDLVLSVDNIEHIEDDHQALTSLAKALKSGGELVLHVPAYERRWFIFTFQTNFDVPGHYRPGYTLNDITRKISEAGLEIKEACYTYGFLENVSNNISYLITKAEAKNKLVYAMIYPLLNFISWMGRNSRPEKGAGILIIAFKPE